MKKIIVSIICILMLSYTTVFAAGVNDWEVLSLEGGGKATISNSGDYIKAVFPGWSGIAYKNKVDPNGFSIEFNIESVSNSYFTVSLMKEKNLMLDSPGLMAVMWPNNNVLNLYNINNKFKDWTTDLAGQFPLQPVKGKHKISFSKNSDGTWKFIFDGEAKNISFNPSMFKDGKAYLVIGADSNTTVTVTKIGGGSTTTTDTSNPKTSDFGTLPFAVLGVFSLFVLVMLKKVKFNNQ
jgi:hypothetical protein